MRVKELFDRGAFKYDIGRRKVIYCFDEFYGTLLDLIPFNFEEYFSFLDLGAGTGLVSSLIKERYPNAEMHLIDISENMMEKAYERFSGYENIHFYIRDYDKEDIPGIFSLVVSAMSIHHLSDSGKQRLFKKVFDSLEAGGYFINADLALGATKRTEAVYQKRWQDHLKQTDLAREELERIIQRMCLDQPATLENQLSWMEATGFEDVDCFFKQYNFTVYSGKKPDNPENQ